MLRELEQVELSPPEDVGFDERHGLKQDLRINLFCAEISCDNSVGDKNDKLSNGPVPKFGLGKSHDTDSW